MRATGATLAAAMEAVSVTGYRHDHGEEPSGSPLPVTPTMIAALWRAAPVRHYLVLGDDTAHVVLVVGEGQQQGIGAFLNLDDFARYARAKNRAVVVDWLTRLHRAAFDEDPVINPGSESAVTPGVKAP